MRSFRCTMWMTLAAITLANTGAASSPSVVIQHATIFDSRSGVMVPGRTLVIEGGHIRAIGADGRLPHMPPRTQLIDARGRYVIPGLIDAHVHVVHVVDFAHMTGDEILPLFLANGVTSLRDVGDNIVAEKFIARYADAHPATSPRLFLCSPFIDGDPPVHADNGVSWAITDPVQVSKFVEDAAAWGATTLKIYVGTKRDVGQKVIEEGHRRGLIVTGHLGKYSAQDAVADGIDCLEHIVSVFSYILPEEPASHTDSREGKESQPGERARLAMESRANLNLESAKATDLIEAVARRKVMVDPTLAVFKDMLLLADLPEVSQNPDNLHVPSRLREFWPTYTHQFQLGTQDLRRKEFKKYQELTGALYKAGVTLLAGTDTPEPNTAPGFSLHDELELLVESGLTPAAALQAATINNARALKQSNELGSVEEGKLADLVILDANPLTDIKNTRKIYRVIRGGVVCDPNVLLRLVPAK